MTVVIPETVINPGRAGCPGAPVLERQPDGRVRATCPDCGSDVICAKVE